MLMQISIIPIIVPTKIIMTIMQTSAIRTMISIGIVATMIARNKAKFLKTCNKWYGTAVVPYHFILYLPTLISPEKSRDLSGSLILSDPLHLCCSCLTGKQLIQLLVRITPLSPADQSHLAELSQCFVHSVHLANSTFFCNRFL